MSPALQADSLPTEPPGNPYSDEKMGTICVCVCVCVCVCICAQQDVAPPSTFLQWVRVNMSSASAGGSASSSHTCLLIWAAKMEPYGYLWTFNRSKAFSSKSQFIGLLYSHGISAF